MRKILSTGLVLAAASFAMPQKSFGLAALAAGAKTSCKPTAPVGSPFYRTQVNCDPTAVESYQISIDYDSSLVHFVSVTGLNGYTATEVGEVTNPTGINIETVTISGRFGGDVAPQGENDVFGVVFDLNDTIPGSAADDLPIFFETFGGPNDFVTAHDTDSPTGTVTYTGDQIATDSADLSMNQIHAVPEPTSAGVLALAATAILGRRKRPA